MTPDDSLPLDFTATSKGNQQTAIAARRFLVGRDEGFVELNKIQKKILVAEFAKAGAIVYGKAFDLVRVSKSSPVNFDDPACVARSRRDVTLYEIKSTNRRLQNFKSFFFSLTTAELLVAQSMGKQYRFAFVDTIANEYIDLTLSEVFAKARAIYPTWSIKF